ncbi:MAG: DNA mismatch repair protein MutS [Treponemataceae bacterium]|nr:DNA mismatch repair protein MutS [Treponemataceae bacterium]
MSEPTPVLAQYLNIKESHKSEVLFFRLGDFYEMFYDDALEVSRLLNLTLTHRADAPMCGIPYHASKIYIARLLRLGKKIAICEQFGDPKAKGLTERKVVEIITPGSVTEEEYLENGVNNYLASICLVKDKNSSLVSYSYLDISTGNFYATHWDYSAFSEAFPKELGRSCPKELIVSQSVSENRDFEKTVSLYPNLSISVYPDWHFSLELSAKTLKTQFNALTLRSFSLTESSPEVASCGFLLEYIKKNSGFSESSILPHVTNLNVYTDDNFLVIDDSSRRNLEITSNLHDGSSAYSLIETVSYTLTSMGKRLLSNWFMYPLTDRNQIIQRENHISSFFSNSLGLGKVREILAKIYDIERLAGRIALEKAHPKDLQTIKLSLINAVEIENLLSDLSFPLLETETAGSIIQLISDCLIEDPPTIITDGGIIKEGYSQELDHWRNVHNNFSSILEQYLEEEKANTGINNLKIRYNNILGYYIEVSKGKLTSVPEHFILRRALVNGDRYTTTKLQELEGQLLKASEQIVSLEKNLFLDLRRKISEHLSYLLQLSNIIAYIDVCASLAYAAQINHWVCPEIVTDSSFEIENGRHPVVEFHLKAGEFVPNSVNLSEKSFALITGPNMAGKSTFLRQNALIALLAQIGSFVPASKAKISIVDRIFCRVGASDNLARGESTFLVEMSETALILRSATEKSLVIMDEVGRGTSTEDGLSLAWAISEYLLNNIKAKTLFATHYHQLTNLEHQFIQMLCMDVIEENDTIVFLRKVKKGAAQNSYGLHVASLAGIPAKVVKRAKEILDTISINNVFTDKNQENIDVSEKIESPKTVNAPGLFSEEELILDSILSTDVNSITPLDALSRISEWKKILSGK